MYSLFVHRNDGVYKFNLKHPFATECFVNTTKS